jgi:co-chaperonin GroES (HSP10)
VKPIGNHLLVQEEIRDQIGGIFLPEKSRMDLTLGRPRVFRVLAVGSGRRTRKGIQIPIETKPGDRVITYSHTTGPVDLPNGHSIISEDQILAVLPSTNP